RFTIHASFPRSVALTQLRFTSFAVINLRRDFHPQECAHAGRTQSNRPRTEHEGENLVPGTSGSTGLEPLA
ncbi:hypothetical protein ACUHMQ_15995, partial [Chitinimonas sp. PSY-7]|uniref:hypothetical protein n=1 Tax=Chitinimonas sp. PSY-7 TaxID=3459088 RepID=UPI00403FE526